MAIYLKSRRFCSFYIESTSVISMDMQNKPKYITNVVYLISR